MVYSCQAVSINNIGNIIDATYGIGAGGFELGAFVNGGGNPNGAGSGYMGLLPGDNTSIQGWTVGGPGDGVDWLLTSAYRADAGLHAVDLQHFTASSVSTVVPTVVGNTYRLSFSAAAVSGRSNTGSVSAGSLVNQAFSAPFSASYTGQTFTPFSFLFSATDTSTIIRFAATGPNTYYGPVIDSVSVVAVSGFFGGSLKTEANYAFTLEQGGQKAESISLLNPGSVARSATLELVNPHAGLTVSLGLANPVSIAAGETKAVPLSINAGSLAAGVYDGLLLKIGSDDGGAIYSNIKVSIVPQGAGNRPDLSLSASDISAVSNGDGTVSLTANVHNLGASPVADVPVRFFEFGDALGQATIAQIAPGGAGSASITVPMSGSGDHLLRVLADPDGALAEVDETNNEASRIVQPGGVPSPTAGHMLVTGNLPSTVYAGSLFTLNVRTVYDLIVNGARNTDYPVKGAPIQITIKGAGGAEWVYGDAHSDINGNLAKSLQAPTTPGTYRIELSATDKTFSARRELAFTVIESPPAGSPPPVPPSPPVLPGSVGQWSYEPLTGGYAWTWTLPPAEPVPQTDLRVFSENIYFSNNNPTASEEITLFAAIQYWAVNTSLAAQQVPVNIYVTYPGTPKLLVGQTLIDSLSLAAPDFGSRYVYATWKNQGEGIYLTEFEIDPSFLEANTSNNAATRAIIVGQLPNHQGAIAGHVTDSWGSGFGNIIIRVADSGGSAIGSVVTDETGFYWVADLPVGGKQVRIETPSGHQADAGMKTAEVADSAVSTVDFLLSTAAAPPADTVPPVLALPGDITVEATGPSGAPVAYTVSATDNVDGPLAPVCAPASGNVFPLGTSAVACSAADQAGNTSSGGFNILVRDTIPPALLCPADIAIVQGQPVNLGVPGVSDIVDPAPVVGNDAPDSFPVGSRSVVWSAADFSGNRSTCSQVVMVAPAPPVNQAPVADAGADRSVRQGSWVVLAGSGSDPDHGPFPLAFAWTQTGGSAVALSGAGTAHPSFTPPAEGLYVFRLVVNDGAADSAPDEVRINVPLLCDIDLDGDVDRNDTSLITAVRNRPMPANDLRDYDGDGMATVNDARACVLKCTRLNCIP